MERIDYFLSQVEEKFHGLKTMDDVQIVNKTLSQFKKYLKPSDNISSILLTIVKLLPEAKKDDMRVLVEKCIRKVIVITLQQKQMSQTFNLIKVHNLFT